MAEDLGYDTDFPSVGEDSKPDSPPSPISTALSPSSPPSSPPSQPSTPPRLTLAASPSSRSSTPASLDLEYPPPPRSPCAFIWRCHLCGARYPLGATRRCLTDGHYYCYGQDTDKNIKRKRRGKSCTSIFDYQGWDDWNEWRRETRDLNFLWGKEDDSPTPGTHSNCWDNCHFPSACRYLDTIQGETYGGASFLDRYLLRRKLSTERKRKELYDATEGVNYLPPSKIPKFRPAPEPEPEPESSLDPEPEPEPELEYEPELDPQSEPKEEEKTGNEPSPVETPRPIEVPATSRPVPEQPIIPGLTLTNPQTMSCVQINVSGNTLGEYPPIKDGPSTEEGASEEESSTEEDSTVEDLFEEDDSFEEEKP